MKQIKDIEDEDLTDEQKEKLKVFNEKNQTLVNGWRDVHGSKPPPIFWDQSTGEFHWEGRELRRQREKMSRRMRARRRVT